MGAKKNEGNCALCGKFGKLSFEHVPPRSAFNNKPVFIQNENHLFDKNNPLYSKKSISQKGFGGYTLCESCNNSTGEWYAKDLVVFAHQGMSVFEIMKKLNPANPFIYAQYKIKPLNVLKQILTMFMSADRSGKFQSQKNLVNFIMDRESNDFPDNYKVFLYSTLGPQWRMMGYMITYYEGITTKWSEINFRPFGYLLAEESPPPTPLMVDISYFKTINITKKL